VLSQTPVDIFLAHGSPIVTEEGIIPPSERSFWAPDLVPKEKRIPRDIAGNHAFRVGPRELANWMKENGVQKGDVAIMMVCNAALKRKGSTIPAQEVSNLTGVIIIAPGASVKPVSSSLIKLEARKKEQKKKWYIFFPGRKEGLPIFPF
jgi:hypothetical protein